MIRVNLFASNRSRPLPTQPVGRIIPLAGSLLLVIAALFGSWRYWTLNRDQARLSAEIEAARHEEARLTDGPKQLAEIDAERGHLRQRLALIGDLRRSQSGPVQIIDEISRSLPDGVWLTTLRQDAEHVTLEGQCTSMTALADFVANLTTTHHFKQPIEIVDSETVASQDTVAVVRFTIKGTLGSIGARPSPTPNPPGGTVG
jgi:type IV pilus assembly protein PilN